MKNKHFLSGISIIFVASFLLAACTLPAASGTPTASATTAFTPAQAAYSDAFAYCAAIGTIDSPDARYTGPQMTTQIITGFLVAAGWQNSSEPMDMLEKTTNWRCMDGKVYACNYGANLPCTSKANTDKTPTQAMQDFCTANPDAVGIPMSVTGHDMVYAWKCNGTSAEIQSQISQVDEAGFIANIWFAIDPNAKLPAATAVPTALDAGQGQILFASKRGGDTFDLYLLNLSSGQVQRLTQRDSNIFPGPFSSDGSRILITGYGLTRSYVGVLSADGTNPVNLTDNDNIDEGFAAWSPDGKQIAFTSRRNGNNEIYIMDSQGKHVQPLTSNPHDDFAPAWSPDGNQIAFVSDRDHSNGTNSIYIIDANGMKVKRLTYDKGSDYSPAWSPDGKQIAFRSDLNGSSNIYLVNADGSQLTELTGSTGDNWWPVWSSDGKRIAFQSNRDGNWEIYLMNSDGSDARNVTNNPADDEMPEWQP